MRVIIAGSRKITDPREIERAIAEAGFQISEVVSGRAQGVDRLGEAWAERHNIPVRLFPADWERHKKAAGFIRNVYMAQYADALIAIWDGKSKGTEHMIKQAQDHNLKLYIKVLLNDQ